jgi:hypothetical protein
LPSNHRCGRWVSRRAARSPTTRFPGSHDYDDDV